MGKKLTVYLMDGRDDGPRTVEIGNWSGKAISCPRIRLFEIMKRSEFDKPGVYLLKSTSSNSNYEQRIYIGESEVLRDRFNQHIRDLERDFDECVAFISKDEMFTKAHIKYIEARLIKMAHEINNSEVENKKIPALNSLPEADISDMEEYINQIKLILPTIGYDVFLSKATGEDIETEVLEDDELVFYIKNKKIKAEMLQVIDGFVVLKGSQAVLEVVDSMSENWKKLRNKLKKAGLLLRKEDFYYFTKDTKFNSTSAAAAVILGRQAPGPLNWIDKNGKTYKEYEIEKINQ